MDRLIDVIFLERDEQGILVLHKIPRDCLVKGFAPHVRGHRLYRLNNDNLLNLEFTLL